MIHNSVCRVIMAYIVTTTTKDVIKMQVCKYCNHLWHRKAIWCKANIKQLVQHNHTFTTSLQQYDPQQPLQLNWKEAFGPILCNCPLSSRKEAARLLRSISERLNPPCLALPRTEEERDAGVSLAATRGGGSSEALWKLAQIVLTWCDCVRRAFIMDAWRRMFPLTYCRCLPTAPHASYQFAWVHGSTELAVGLVFHGAEGRHL